MSACQTSRITIPLRFLAAIAAIAVFAATPARGALTNTWSGNGPNGAAITSLAISNSAVYAGTAVGGVYRNPAGALAWNTASTGLSSGNILTLLLDPAASTTLYAGTSGGGVFKSTNSGANWNSAASGLPVGSVVPALAISGSSLFAGVTGGGVFQSVNGGTSWTPLNGASGTPLANVNILSLAVQNGAPATLFAGTVAGGIFRSSDGGTNWSQTATGLPNGATVRALIVDTTTTPATLYAGIDANGVYKSNDGGASWGNANNGLPVGVTVHSFLLRGGSLYASTSAGLYLTTDGAASWNERSTGLLNRSSHALAIDPTTPAIMFIGTDGGAYRSTDSGSNWSEFNSGILADVGSLAIDPATRTNIYAGTAGSGVFKSEDSGTSWAALTNGLSNSVVNGLAITSNGNIYAATAGGVMHNTVGGTSWNSATTGITTADVRAVAVDPLTPAILYAGTWGGGVFKSVDAAASWTISSTGLSDLEVSCLAIDPIVSTNLFAGTNGGGIFKSADAGSTWASANTGLGHTVITSLAIGGSGIYAGTIGGGVYKSTNGDQWNLANSGLANTDVVGLSVDKSVTPDLVTAATRGGVFVSTDAALSWHGANTGLPTLGLLSLALDGMTGKKIYAGLAGKGTVRLSMSATATVSPTTVDFGSVNITTPATSRTIAVTLSNSGILNLAVSSLTITGTDAAMFIMVPGGVNPCSNLTPTLLPGGNCTLEITFTPASVGSKSATLAIVSSDLNSPSQVSLLGNGVVPPGSTIIAPAAGAYLKGSSVTVSVSATASGATVSGVDISTNAGSTWHPATYDAGSGYWKYSWSLPADGSYTLKSRARDSSGNLQPVPASVALFVNNVLPQSTISSPVSNAALRGANCTVSGTAVDAGAGLQRVEVEVSIGGVTTWLPAVGTSNWTLDWPLPGIDGSYQIRARAIDNAGDIQTVLSSVTVTVDNTAPASLISSPSNGAQLRGATYLLSGTASDANAGLLKMEVSLDGGTTWLPAVGTSSWSYTWTLPGSFANTTLRSRATDHAGNVETVGPAVDVTVDNVAPTTIITTPANGSYLKGSIQNITGTAADVGLGVQKVELSFDGGTTWLPATGTTNWTFTWALPADGPYTIIARSTDLIGNSDVVPARAGVVVNNLLPISTITAPVNGGAIRGTTYTITGTAADAGAAVQKVEVEIDVAGTPTWVAAAGTTTWSYTWTLPTLNGAYTIRSRATDNAGDLQAPVTSLTVTVDNVPPLSAITVPSNGANLNGSTFTIQGTASDTGGAGLNRVEVSTDGGTTWQTATGTTTWSFVWTLPTINSPFSVKARAVDNAGNVQQGTLPTISGNVYNIPPTSTITLPDDNALLRGNSVTISGTAADAGLGVATVQLSFDGGTSWVDANGTDTWSYSWTLPADGLYAISSRSINLVGMTQATPVVIHVTIDNTAPITTLSGTPLPSSNVATPVFSFSVSEATTSITCSLDGAPFTPCTSPHSTGSLADGAHLFSVRAVDLAGNVEANQPVHNWTIDTITPRVTATVPATGATRTSVNSPVSVSFSEAMNPATITASTFFLDHGAVGSVSYDPTTRTASFTATPRLAYATTYTATVTTAVRDPAGNPLPAVTTFSFSTDPDGDVNLDGTVDISDAVACLQIAVGHLTATASQQQHGDVAPLLGGKPNPNGRLDVGDVVVILERVVGISTW